MVAAFPAAKLFFLVIKQISKPIAKSVADRARKSPIFKKYVCLPVAQFFHWYEVKIRMQTLGLGKVKKVPKLNESEAIETGAQLLSEFLLFGIAAGVLIYEYNRSSEKEEAKQEAIKKQEEEQKNKIMNLVFTVEKQEVQIRELTRLAHHIQSDLHKRSMKGLLGAKSPDLPKELQEVEKTTSEQCDPSIKDISFPIFPPESGVISDALNSLLVIDNETEILPESRNSAPRGIDEEEGIVLEAINYIISGND